MSVVLTVHNLSKAFGAQVLFQDLSFSVHDKDRIGIIGPNGSGKSSLIKILAGLEEPDGGYLTTRQGLKIGYSSQSPEFPDTSIENYLMSFIPQQDEHAKQTHARIWMGKAEIFDGEQLASQLSGGWKKRLDIVAAMVKEPDLLLLDEPTNHLDLEGIMWLENFLLRLNIPFIVISHDRFFLEKTANRIIEINRAYQGGMLQCHGNMSAFYTLRDEYHATQEKKERELRSKVRDEVNWLRTSPKARTTKSQSRVDQAYELIDELADVKQRRKTRSVGVDFTASDRETRKLLVGNNIGKTIGDKQLFKGIDLTLTPGLRLGIVGKNGTGKTTLLKILSGEIEQSMGTLKRADDLEVVYFDQHRESIPLDATVKEALAPNGDMVDYRGQSIHVNGWGKRFLFSPERMNLPVKYLSGGERARILIAKLMLKPADVLLLDEPTNDLDISTLEVMEESLSTFNGAVVLISHDRCLMDNVCNRILSLEEKSEHHFYADYKQWEKRRIQPEVKTKVEKSKPKPSVRKLSYKEKLELEGMEEKILHKEEEIETLNHKAQQPNAEPDTYGKLAQAQKELENLYERWQELMDVNG